MLRAGATTAILISLLVVCAALDAVQAAFTHGRKLQAYGQRQEWRQLDAQQQADFLNAIKCLKARPDSSGDSSRWSYDQFVRFHAKYVKKVHGNGFFLPWHRYTLVKFEKAVQSCHPDQASRPLYIPYWDYALDAGNMVGAPVWSADTFGTNGVASEGNCVMDGQFAGGQFAVKINPIGGKSCVQRAYLSDGSWAGDSAATIAEGLSAAGSFEQMSTFVDYGPHGRVHNGINGNMWYVASSANDPIFWLVHASVDRMWSRWQNSFSDRCPSAAKGWNSGTKTKLSTKLPGWKGITVSTCILTTNQKCNYVYSDSASDRQLQPPCPAKRLSARLLRSDAGQAPASAGGLRSLLQAPQGKAGGLLDGLDMDSLLDGFQASNGSNVHVDVNVTYEGNITYYGNNTNGRNMTYGGNSTYGGNITYNGDMDALNAELVGIVAGLLKDIGAQLQGVKDTNFQCQLPLELRTDKEHVCYPLGVADEWYTFHKMDPALGQAVQQQAEVATDTANLLLDQQGIQP